MIRAVGSRQRISVCLEFTALLTLLNIPYTGLTVFFANSSIMIKCDYVRKNTVHHQTASVRVKPCLTPFYRPLQPVLHGRLHGDFGSPNQSQPPPQSPNPPVDNSAPSSLAPNALSKGFP